MVGGGIGQETVLLEKNLTPCPSCDIYAKDLSVNRVILLVLLLL
jgi:hypothetical protein